MLTRDINLKLILEGCRDGNRNSQRRLYEHFYGYGMNICMRYSKNRDVALEILNDSFLKALTNLDKYDNEYPFKGWLRRILITTAIDYFRANQKLPDHLDLEEAAEAAGSYDLPMRKYHLMRIYAADSSKVVSGYIEWFLIFCNGRL